LSLSTRHRPGTAPRPATPSSSAAPWATTAWPSCPPGRAWPSRRPCSPTAPA
jgi:hypothetical protein